MIFLSKSALEAKKREGTKQSIITKIRRDGGFPAVVYGKDKPTQSVYVNAIDFTKTIKDVGRNGIIHLQIDETAKEKVMLQDIQTDPLKGEVVHADFFIVDMKSDVDAEVAVHLIGESQGVKDGGILQQPLHHVSVKALPGDIPEKIEVDVTGLNVGDNIQISDLKDKGNFEFTDDEDTVVVSILPPTVEEKTESGEVQDGEDVKEVAAEATDEVEE